MKMLRDFLITEFPRENYEIVPVFSRQPININPEDCVFFEGSSNAAIQKSPFFIIQNARITNTGQIYEGMRLSSSFFGYWATEDFKPSWEIPRLCRGGSRSLTFTGVHR